MPYGHLFLVQQLKDMKWLTREQEHCTVSLSIMYVHTVNRGQLLKARHAVYQFFIIDTCCQVQRLTWPTSINDFALA